MKPLQLLLFILAIAVQAQVGINTETPNQMLDVNGKIAIADDASLPTEGSMRFNNTEADFEGYAGGAWQSMTGRSFFPKNAVPYYGWTTGVLPGETESVRFKNTPSSGTIVTVPTGKHLIVTSIILKPNALFTTDPPQYLTFGPRRSGYTYTDYYRSFTIAVRAHQINRLQGENGFLFIMYPGEDFVLTNDSRNTQAWEARITGFLVDDLDFN